MRGEEERVKEWVGVVHVSPLPIGFRWVSRSLLACLHTEYGSCYLYGLWLRASLFIQCHSTRFAILAIRADNFSGAVHRMCKKRRANRASS